MEAILSTGAPAPSLPLALDHLVVAARSLDEGEAWLRERLRRPLAAGGAHPGFGTHNRLLRLGSGCYLELLAPDPAQSVASLLFGLDQAPMVQALANAPLLMHVVLRVVAPATLEEVLPRLDYDPGVPTPMTRADLRWRITIPAGGRVAGDGLLPTIIDWARTPHPCTRLPESGVRLRGLRLSGSPSVLNAFPDLALPAGDDDPPKLVLTEAQCSTISAEFAIDGEQIIIESVLPARGLA
jgi:hypothetical protein